MDVRAKLRPNEGTLLNSLSSEAEVKFPPIHLTDVRVEEILNHLVNRSPYAVWVLHRVSPDLREAIADGGFVTLVPYADGLAEIRNLCCASSGNPAH